MNRSTPGNPPRRTRFTCLPARWGGVLLGCAACLAAARGGEADYAGDASAIVPSTISGRIEAEESDQDRLAAEAYFCAGRLLELRGDYAGALRRYRRALRYDPSSLTIARNLVRVLTFHLPLPDEAARHAVHAVESGSDDPVLLQRLGLFLVESGEFGRASALFEKAVSVYERDEGTNLPAEAALLRIELGRIYLLLEDNDSALAHFEKAVRAVTVLEKTGAAPVVQRRLAQAAGNAFRLFAESLLAADRLDEAEAAFAEADRRVPDRAFGAFAQARLLEKRNQHDKALEQLEVYLQAPSVADGAEPYVLLARLLKQTGDSETLFKRLRRYYALHCDNPALGYFLADRLLEEDRPRDAEAVYARLVRESPAIPAARKLLDLYRRDNRHEDALELLGKFAAPLGSLAILEEEAGRVEGNEAFTEGVLRVATAQLAQEPEEFGFAKRLAAAQVATEARRFDDAKPFYLAAMEIEPESSAEIALSWGLALLAADRPAEAVEVLNDANARAETATRSHLIDDLLATALALSGDAEGAVTVLRRALRRRPDSAALQSRLGWVLFHTGRTEEGEEAYRELVAKYDDDYPDAEIREAIREAKLALAVAAVGQDRHPDAEEWLEQILDEFPDDPDALNDLAYLWADRKAHPERAERMARRAVEAFPEEAAFRDTLGWALFRLGRHAEAKRELELAVGLGDPDPILWEHLAQTLTQLGETEAAEEAWRNAAAEHRKAGNEVESNRIEAALQPQTK